MNAFTFFYGLGYYLIVNYNEAKNEIKNSKIVTMPSRECTMSLILYFVFGLIMMVIGSRLLVDNGVVLAAYIGIPTAVISLTVIALGTSLPELVASLTAIKKGHHALSLGNVLGANILNITSVIGISALIESIPILAQSSQVDYPFMVIIFLIVMIPTTKTNKFTRVQGLALLGAYMVYMANIYFMYIQ